jgi:hypothetical protein
MKFSVTYKVVKRGEKGKKENSISICLFISLYEKKDGGGRERYRERDFHA